MNLPIDGIQAEIIEETHKKVTQWGTEMLHNISIKQD